MSSDIEAPDPLSAAIGEFRSELLLWIDTEIGRLKAREAERRQEPADDLAIAQSARPPVVAPEQPIDPEPRPTLANPRQRLDALARLLDRRLKQVQGATEASGAAGPELGAAGEKHGP